MVRGVRKNLGKGLEQLPRGIEVWQSLREVDASDLRADPGHLADDRLLKGARAAGKRKPLRASRGLLQTSLRHRRI